RTPLARVLCQEWRYFTLRQRGGHRRGRAARARSGGEERAMNTRASKCFARIARGLTAIVALTAAGCSATQDGASESEALGQQSQGLVQQLPSEAPPTATVLPPPPAPPPA